MESMPYVPGFNAAEPGPLSRFLPPLEDGPVGTWLSRHVAPSSWLLDPFGFSPRLAVEAARAGYRVLVTVNNPITHALLEMTANAPSEADFKAALAELADSKKGNEHLEAHLRSLYLSHCAQCGREVEAEAFIWSKDDVAPHAKIYDCKECGDKGERPATLEDFARAGESAAGDPLHRSRALERVAAAGDDDRINAQEAIQLYVPRPLYALTTIINRLDSLDLTPERRQALTALVLVACDTGNSLWSYPAERVRPKALTTPNQFREQNVWMMLERGLGLWTETAARVECVKWPNKIPGTSGICIYDGRLSSLAREVKKEIPIAAVIGSVPRPNQAFWTFSALWAGWLWGRTAVEPYRVALRRRRYDWPWNATALHAAFTHLSELMALGTPFFGLLPEAEPLFLTSAVTAISAAGFNLKGLALRTEGDPIQFVWERGERLTREVSTPQLDAVRKSIEDYLAERGEPATYLHVHAHVLQTLAEAHALKPKGGEFDEVLRNTQSMITAALKDDGRLVHHSLGEAVEAGLWGLREPEPTESLVDRVETAIVTFLQSKPSSIFLEVEEEAYQHFGGLLTPSHGIIYAILNSYAEKEGSLWNLRAEDVAAARRGDLETIEAIVEAIGKRLKYHTRKDGKWLIWDENGKLARAFIVLESARVGEVIAENPHPPQQSVLVVPGGRASLVAYKAQRDPLLAAKLKDYRIAKYRLWRTLASVPRLTRETFEEQLSSDPIERSQGQMIMF